MFEGTFEDSKSLLDHINKERVPNTLMETLDIVFTKYTQGRLEATMPVNQKVHQPQGILHGGASAAFAESIGSTLSNIEIDRTLYYANGIQLECSHVKKKSEGNLTAIAEYKHKGKTTHVVQISIVDEQNNLISFCKLINLILSKN